LENGDHRLAYDEPKAHGSHWRRVRRLARGLRLRLPTGADGALSPVHHPRVPGVSARPAVDRRRWDRHTPTPCGATASAPRWAGCRRYTAESQAAESARASVGHQARGTRDAAMLLVARVDGPA